MEFWSDVLTRITPLPICAAVGQAVPGVSNLWAPEVFEHKGVFYLYYSASTFTSTKPRCSSTNVLPATTRPVWRLCTASR